MKNTFIGTVDRIEGSIAVIIASDDKGRIEISRTLLPENSKEGDIISFSLNIKDKRTKDEKEKIKGLIDELVKKGGR